MEKYPGLRSNIDEQNALFQVGVMRISFANVAHRARNVDDYYYYG